jgi:hypothetical protein
MIWMGMMMTTGVLILLITGGFWKYGISWKILSNTIYILLTVSLPSCIFFGLSLLWPLHVWKTHLPLRFNRNTRKVYFHWKGKTYVENWDEIKAYLKVQFLVTATGAPLNDPQINLEFHNEDGSTFTVFLMGVDRDDLTTDQEAAAFWEYIRRYMEEGPEKLPAPDWGIYAPLEFKELVQAHNPLPVLKSKRKWLWPFEVILFFPVRCIWFSIAYPTEVIYYFVEKHVQTNPFPPEMEEACNRDESVKVWYPKQHAEKAA